MRKWHVTFNYGECGLDLYAYSLDDALKLAQRIYPCELASYTVEEIVT